VNLIKRVFLFIITNLLVVMTLGIVFNVLSHYFGWKVDPAGSLGLIIMATLFGFGGAFISLLMSKQMAKWFQHVKVIDPNTHVAEERWLVDTVYALARKAGLEKMPEVGSYESPEVNAFATGPGRNDALVAVSTGLMEAMDRDQAEGVLGHEITHVANGDMVTMTLVQGVINTFVFLLSWIISQIIVNAMSRSDDRRGGGNFFMQYMIRNLLQMVLSFLGFIVVAAFSRWREFRADAGGARLAGKQKMISALQALQEVTERNREAIGPHSAFSSLKISGGPGSLFATHPPLEVRIERLRAATMSELE
jgi:heat shock protein HtpX